MNNYEFNVNEGFTGSYTEEIIDGITYLKVKVSSDTPACPRIHFKWESPDIGTNVFWQPKTDRLKKVHWNWTKRFESSASYCAPIISNVGYDDLNRLTIAVSDSINFVELRSGLIENNACFDNGVDIILQEPVTEYSATIRIDERKLPFYEVIGAVGEWWRNECGYKPAYVPECSYHALYSTWYAFLQNPTAEGIFEECKIFKALGCDTVIIDDGWQGGGESVPMGNNGDWVVCTEKFPDMKGFVEALHEMGMKVMVWFPAPFVGFNTEAYKKFKDKTIERGFPTDHALFDMRYPEVRKYIVDTYCRVMKEWNLDGVKLDYWDSCHKSLPGKEGMDTPSLQRAVERTLIEVNDALHAINPEAMIEFRQDYVSPLMHQYCTMIRAMDCPNDSFSNRLFTLDLRLLSGDTAIHSDMLMWHGDEPADEAAYQITNVLFSVPQISVRWNEISDEQRKMIGYYLGFCKENREVLMHGDMFYKNLAADFAFVSAAKDGTEVAALYAGQVAGFRGGNNTVKLVNASPETTVYVENPDKAVFSYVTRNCMGEIVGTGKADFTNGFTKVDVPQNGTVEFTR